MPDAITATPHVFDATTSQFQAEVLQRSLEVPVLVDFWASWCGPCKTLGPLLEKLAAEYHGAFVLAKVDIEAEPELAGAFQIRSVPTVMLVKDGQLVDGFPGALPEGQLREFLGHHGIQPAEPAGDAAAEGAEAPALSPEAEIERLRAAVAAEPERDELKLDLAVALLRTGDSEQARALLDGLPANLATDDRALHAHARLGFSALLRDAPPPASVEATLAADPDDLRALHLRGAHRLVGGDDRGALDDFLRMLELDRDFDDGLPRKALIDAFRVIDDPALVGAYRRRMSSLLF